MQNTDQHTENDALTADLDRLNREDIVESVPVVPLTPSLPATSPASQQPIYQDRPSIPRAVANAQNARSHMPVKRLMILGTALFGVVTFALVASGIAFYMRNPMKSDYAVAMSQFDSLSYEMGQYKDLTVIDISTDSQQQSVGTQTTSYVRLTSAKTDDGIGRLQTIEQKLNDMGKDRVMLNPDVSKAFSELKNKYYASVEDTKDLLASKADYEDVQQKCSKYSPSSTGDDATRMQSALAALKVCDASLTKLSDSKNSTLSLYAKAILKFNQSIESLSASVSSIKTEQQIDDYLNSLQVAVQKASDDADTFAKGMKELKSAQDVTSEIKSLQTVLNVNKQKAVL